MTVDLSIPRWTVPESAEEVDRAGMVMRDGNGVAIGVVSWEDTRAQWEDLVSRTRGEKKWAVMRAHHEAGCTAPPGVKCNWCVSVETGVMQ